MKLIGVHSCERGPKSWLTGSLCFHDTELDMNRTTNKGMHPLLAVYTLWFQAFSRRELESIWSPMLCLTHNAGMLTTPHRSRCNTQDVCIFSPMKGQTRYAIIGTKMQQAHRKNENKKQKIRIKLWSLRGYPTKYVNENVSTQCDKICSEAILLIHFWWPDTETWGGIGCYLQWRHLIFSQQKLLIWPSPLNLDNILS